MKKLALPVLALAAVFMLSGCGEGSSGASVPTETEEFSATGADLETGLDIRKIDDDVYATYVVDGAEIGAEEISELFGEVEGAVGEGHYLYIDSYDLETEYNYQDDVKYKSGYITGVADLFGTTADGKDYEWTQGNYNPYNDVKFDVEDRITIPAESLEAWYQDN